MDRNNKAAESRQSRTKETRAVRSAAPKSSASSAVRGEVSIATTTVANESEPFVVSKRRTLICPIPSDPSEARSGDDNRRTVKSREASQSDRALIERCLSGEPTAWTTLYEQCHAPLVQSVRALLGRNAVHHDVVDEIAARVWFAVIDRDGQLLNRFDGQRGCRLSTFLAGLAKNEISRHYRTERRRNARETEVCRSRSKVLADSHLDSRLGLTVAVSSFLATLTSSERSYCQDFLLNTDEELRQVYSDTNRWQLNHRVRLKLGSFLSNQ